MTSIREMYAMDASDTLRSSVSRSRLILACRLFLSLAIAGYAPTVHSQYVVTYHYDDLRTGWNANETTLTPMNVPNLQLLASVSLDEQVDAQPLLVTGLTIAGSTHDVLYAATENNTVYALDAGTGATLATRNFGARYRKNFSPGTAVATRRVSASTRRL